MESELRRPGDGAARDQETGPTPTREALAELAGSLGQGDAVDLVWGPRQQVGDRVVIPVARVARGGRFSRWRSAVAIEPLGAFELSPKGTRFVPVVNLSRLIATVFTAVFGLVGLLGLAKVLSEARRVPPAVVDTERPAASRGNRAAILSPSFTFAPRAEIELEVKENRVASPSFQDAFKR